MHIVIFGSFDVAQDYSMIHPWWRAWDLMWGMLGWYAGGCMAAEAMNNDKAN